MKLSINLGLRAEHYYQLGEYEESLCYARRSLMADPEQPAMWYLMAVIHHRLGNIDQEAKCFMKAVGLALDCGNTHKALGICLGKLGRIGCIAIRIGDKSCREEVVLFTTYA
ncbi:MAG: tetratricopeptide repeat protein [Limnochordia bacterium]